jgi:hypothetical protein
MLNHAVELLDHGYNHVIRLIIPVFKALPSYERTLEDGPASCARLNSAWTLRYLDLHLDSAFLPYV